MIESGPGGTTYDDEMVNFVKVLVPNADRKKQLCSQVRDLICAMIGDGVTKITTIKSIDIHEICYIKYVRYQDKDAAQLQLLEVLHPFTKCLEMDYLLPDYMLKPLKDALITTEKVSAKTKIAYQKLGYNNQKMDKVKDAVKFG